MSSAEVSVYRARLLTSLSPTIDRNRCRFADAGTELSGYAHCQPDQDDVLKKVMRFNLNLNNIVSSGPVLAMPGDFLYEE